jgi:hypothetical protein
VPISSYRDVRAGWRDVHLRELRHAPFESSDAYAGCGLMRDHTAVIVFVATIILAWGGLAYVGVLL